MVTKKNNLKESTPGALVQNIMIAAYIKGQKNTENDQEAVKSMNKVMHENATEIKRRLILFDQIVEILYQIDLP